MGICAGVAFAYWGIKEGNNPVYAVSVLASITGAMLPDIDHNKTSLGTKRKMVVDAAVKVPATLFSMMVVAICAMLVYSGSYMQLVLVLLLIILPAIALTILAQIPFVRKAMRFSSKHRGIMHTLAIPLLLFFGAMLVTNEIARINMLALATGYASHLVLDCLTKMGCPILWPIYRRNISLLPIKTGNAWEYIVSYSLAGAVLAAVILLV